VQIAGRAFEDLKPLQTVRDSSHYTGTSADATHRVVPVFCVV
jgi:hypothetical protein